MTSELTVIKRALLSVWDKAGLGEFARGLHEAGVELISTGATARAVREAEVPVTDVSEITGFPEILDGRVKTLHPTIHAGLLADRSKKEHLAALAELGITGIDLLVSNLYPFRETVAQAGVDPAQAIETIDIGGPAMTRAAAKNHAHVTVLVDPADYGFLLEEVHAHGGVTSATRARLAAKAFARTAAYDADIAAWMARDEGGFPERFGPVYAKAQSLRYGENPHQEAAYYVERGAGWGLGSARQLGGNPLSYNNLLDADAAWAVVRDFDEPCVAIVKHTNPAGLAVARSLADAYPRALAGDPLSAFGGIVAVNRPLEEATARQIVEVFTEVVVAPSFSDAALEVLRTKRNLRLLEITRPDRSGRPLETRTVSGGLLVQEADVAAEDPSSWTVPTAAKPDDWTLAELAFAWTVCKHVKSNAIVLTRDQAVVGIGAGQPSRVDSVRIAISKSAGRAGGSVLASDAFFPFRDGPDLALDAGVAALVQPGGSVRDAETIAACDERNIPMVFTARRHFRH
ncbi:MAG: bifunctional phosphoribosylaminoimidazolecarboxamide formyltransferase/IMP cyclohydrolase [Egibacteraceae bacterium]